MDYVILHELVHTRYKNHGKDFWAELDRFVPNSKKRAAQLRKHVIEEIR
jgi:predicted metal-dependent hydrolase